MNLALYREFRPKNFDEVVGQDYIIQTLKNQIKLNRLTHAYLFCGPRGTGKTSTAKIFAKAVNCTHTADGNPCGLCAECVALSEPNTDIIEIDAASNNRVEEIRDLREKVNFPPLIGKYKVYIIDEVHMLTDSAFNALLKTLEEPPQHVIFILATTEIHKLPATILSRCTRFDFKLLPMETLVNHLKDVFERKGITCDEKSLHLIAKAGEGSVRDMLSIADSVASFCNYNITLPGTQSVIGLSGKDAIKNLLTSLNNKDVAGLFTNIKTALGTGKNVQLLCKETADFVKQLILIKVGVNDYSALDILPGEFSSVNEFANLFDLNFLKQAFSKFSEVELNLKYSLNPENLFESACLQLFDVNSNSELNQKQPNIKPSKVEVQPSQAELKPAEINPADLNKPAQEQPQSTNELDRVWGYVLIKVKQANMFALSNALTSVIRVEKINEQLILHANDLSNLEFINKPDKLELLIKIINQYDESIKKIELIYDKQNASTKDIKDNLKDAFKNKIKFKD